MPKGTGWRSIPLGGIIMEPGNSVEYLTGGWRGLRPVRDVDKCIQCLQCWVMCPDATITVADQKMTGFDYDHCKGCGVCAQVCPTDCISMVEENKFNQSGDQTK